jgi:ribosomal protein S18 acetylase RimI-like enzyme
MHVVREFEPADQDRVRHLVQTGLRERWGDDYDDSYNQDLVDISTSYVDNGATVLVIEQRGALIATGTLLRLEEQRGQLVRISVAADQRRVGLGRVVVGELIDRARSEGIVELQILADTAWSSACELYRSCGFAATNQNDVDTFFRMPLE